MQDLSLKEIENIGVDVQECISEQMSALLKDTKCLDIGKAGNCLVALSSSSDKLTKKITKSLSGHNALQKIFISPRRWLARFETIEKSIDKIPLAVDAEVERLSNILTGLISSIGVMRENQGKLESTKAMLKSIITDYNENPDLDADGFKRQAAISRLKVLTTTSTLTQQEISKAVLVIQENQEITNQLKEASANLVPMFKTMMVNVIAAKANEEAVALKKNLVVVANNLVIDSAKSIATTADNLIEGRHEALIAPQTLDEANQIIQSAVQRVLDSSKAESEVNLEVIKSLEESAMQVKSLYSLGGISNGGR